MTSESRLEVAAVAERDERAAPLTARVVSFRVGESQFAVLSVPLADGSAMAELTSVEREVATLAAAGLTNGDIGRSRGTSERTVANQIASILRKLRVGSRYGLAARLALCALKTGPR